MTSFMGVMPVISYNISSHIFYSVLYTQIISYVYSDGPPYWNIYQAGIAERERERVERAHEK